jgi:hypothetical protein
LKRIDTSSVCTSTMLMRFENTAAHDDEFNEHQQRRRPEAHPQSLRYIPAARM